MTKAYLEEFAIEEDDVAEGKNNSLIGLESESAQTLSQGQIEAIKAKTGGSEEIIKAL